MPKRVGKIMNCKDCEMLLKEIELLHSLLKVEEQKNKELMKLLNRMEQSNEFKL